MGEVIRFLAESSDEYREDFHDQKLKAGYYTMRYAALSGEDARDFLVLNSPVTADRDPARQRAGKRSTYHSERGWLPHTGQPAVLSLATTEISANELPRLRNGRKRDMHSCRTSSTGPLQGKWGWRSLWPIRFQRKMGLKLADECFRELSEKANTNDSVREYFVGCDTTLANRLGYFRVIVSLTQREYNTAPARIFTRSRSRWNRPASRAGIKTQPHGQQPMLALISLEGKKYYEEDVLQCSPHACRFLARWQQRRLRKSRSLALFLA